MKKLKYVNGLINNDFAEIFLYDQIGYDEKTYRGIDGRQFAHELRYLTDYHEPTPKEVKVRINSVGGSVMDGFSIFSAIYEANKSGKVKVNTYCDGVAASIAGLILMAGKNVYMKDYARLMLHGVNLLDENGNIKASENNSEVLALTTFKDMIKEVFAKNTDVPEGQLEELLTNGKDNWFTAAEAAAAGFLPAENIEDTGLEMELPAQFDAFMIANKAQKFIENKSNTKPLKMKRVIALLKLQEGSSEEVVAEAVQNALKASSDSAEALLAAENKLTEKENEIATLKTQVEAANKLTAVAFVENAIKEGKFAPKDETEKEALVKQAVENPEGFKSMVNMMPTKAANIIDQTTSTSEGAEGLIAKINNRTLREIEKNEPSLLVKLKNEAKSEFVKLWNAQYGTNKTEADFK